MLALANAVEDLGPTIRDIALYTEISLDAVSERQLLF